MKKLVLSLLFIFCFSFFSYSVTFDILGSLTYKNTFVQGKTSSNNNTVDFDASINCLGLNFGLDLLFTDFFGLYTRLGYYGIENSDRTVNRNKKELKSSAGNYSMTFDLGTTFNCSINNHFYFCAAPSFSMNYINYEYYAFSFFSDNYSSVDNYLCYGLTADLYFKFRYKHFVCAAGCSGSVLPICQITSKDTSINYSHDIKDAIGYNIRPYIAAGLSF